MSRDLEGNDRRLSQQMHPNSLKNLEKGTFKKGVPSNPLGRGVGKRNMWTEVKNLLKKEIPEEVYALLTDADKAAIKAMLKAQHVTGKTVKLRHVAASIGVIMAIKGDFKFWKELMDRSAGPITQKIEADIHNTGELETMTDEQLVEVLEQKRRLRESLSE
jgi:hypothetical protein